MPPAAVGSAALALARDLVGTGGDPATADGADRVAAEADPVPGESVDTGEADGVVYVLGGGGIYELFQPHLDGMALSHVDGAYEGDTYYPEWDEAGWEVAEETEYDRFTLREWVRQAR